ncbi:TIGR03960 family B12-binding radical SAM protein [Desulfogranum marinum]|uniref:TIGR03960 family B12-binding radical SAM protein n=1 Tax=Desulfogranum marinum TaxID=453220 RepID=UPI001E2DD635|nr:TIGR03960 family B12-binding radical SAM protein [Desulfogranum marinum]
MNKQVNIEQILPLVRKPGRYIGGELNVVDKTWEEEQVHFCLIFPDLYEIGMSHQGLQILYHILNQRSDALAHRCFTPDVDMEAALKARRQPLFSLEQRRPLADYDILGITLPYELCFTNILTVLDLAFIPIHAKDRNEQHPIILGGGAAAFNPEPVADFFDAIVLGDGEEIVEELTEQFLQFKQQGQSREEILKQLSTLTGVYVPSFFQPQYNGSRITSVEPLLPEYTSVMRRVLPEMQSPALVSKPLVPIVKPIHDRLGIEIARGCTRGCRFCQAGMTYRPVRERSVDDIMELAEAGITNSGFDELALLSLSTGDYSCLDTLMTKLMDRFADEYVSVSMPSMRVGTLTPVVMDQIKRVRKTGFTVAPEAGTDRLREVINKGIFEKDLMDTCQDAFALGWNLIKFYFMIGLPTETDEDVEAIVELARKAKLEAGQGRGGKVKINVSIGTFVPKPHTPFQWEPQISREQSRAKINRLKQILPRKGFALKWHEPEQSYLEGVFSRGDRRLADLILTAWQKGARLDGWSEHFNLNQWQVAADECGIEMDTYLRERTLDEILPWDHLHSGVDRQFLEQELADAKKQLYTEDCRNGGCQQCGICDFETIKPRVNEKKEASLPPAPLNREKIVKPERTAFVYRVSYSRMGDSRFYGHLEILQLIFRALHRAGLPVLFSQGYNPSPKVSFSQALPVGIESRAEYFYVELGKPLSSLAQTITNLDAQLPATITVTDITLEKKVRQASYCAMYKVTLDEFSENEIQQQVIAFNALDQLVIERIRKKKRRQLDLRPLVASMEAQGHDLFVELLHYHGQAGTNPREVLEHGLNLSPEQALLVRIQKVEIREIETPA